MAIDPVVHPQRPVRAPGPVSALGLTAVAALALRCAGPLLAPLGRLGAAAAGSILCVGLPAVLAIGRAGAPRLPLARPSGGAWLGTLLTGLGMPSVSYLLYVACEPLLGGWRIGSNGLTTRFLAESLQQPLAAVVALALVPAVCEELLFRGCVLPRIADSLGKAWAVVLSAILFAVAHLDLVAVPPRALLGVVLGYAVVRTASLWPAIVLHGVNNAAALALAAWVAPAGGATEPPAMAEADVWCAMGLGLGVAAVGLWLLATAGTEPGDADRE